jgi:hypothetical protein
MAVIEYMLVKEGAGRKVPEFVGDRGHWFNPSDNSWIGWVADTRDYYVPDTIVYLTKEQFVARQLAIHAVSPIKGNLNIIDQMNGIVAPDLTEAEVVTNAEEWYDFFVSVNTQQNP